MKTRNLSSFSHHMTTLTLSARRAHQPVPFRAKELIHYQPTTSIKVETSHASLLLATCQGCLSSSRQISRFSRPMWESQTLHMHVSWDGLYNTIAPSQWSTLGHRPTRHEKIWIKKQLGAENSSTEWVPFVNAVSSFSQNEPCQTPTSIGKIISCETRTHSTNLKSQRRVCSYASGRSFRRAS